MPMEERQRHSAMSLVRGDPFRGLGLSRRLEKVKAVEREKGDLGIAVLANRAERAKGSPLGRIDESPFGESRISSWLISKVASGS